CDQPPRERQQRLVGGSNLVEVAVAAHERQQLGEVRLGDALDRQGESSSRSSPTVRPGGKVASFSSASSTPGTNASRENVSCRMVSSWPSPPSKTSWCATSPGSRTEWIGGSPGRRSAVARAVPDGASFLPSWWSSTISARGRYSAAASANLVISTAPIAKFGTTSSCSERSNASASSCSSSAPASPLVPTIAGTPCSRAPRAFPAAA